MATNMGIDNYLSCEECGEYICMARNGQVCPDPDSLAVLSAFLNKHSDWDHKLIFAPDDVYPRVKGGKPQEFEDIEGNQEEIAQQRSRYHYMLVSEATGIERMTKSSTKTTNITVMLIGLIDVLEGLCRMLSLGFWQPIFRS